MTETPSPAAPVHRKTRWRLWGGVAAGIAILAAAGAGWSLWQARKSFAPVQDFEKHGEKLNLLESSIQSLQNRATRPAATDAGITALAERVQKLESSSAPMATDLAPLQQRLEDMARRLAEVETRQAELKQSEDLTLLWQIALHQQAALLAERINRGEPFPSELRFLENLSQRTRIPLPQEQVAWLAGVASLGVPSIETLSAELDSVEKSIDLLLPAERPAKGQNEITDALVSFINLKKVDQATDTQRQGALDDVGSAREHLNDANILAALETLTNLPQPVQQDLAFEAWVERAQLAQKARQYAGEVLTATAGAAPLAEAVPAIPAGERP